MQGAVDLTTLHKVFVEVLVLIQSHPAQMSPSTASADAPPLGRCFVLAPLLQFGSKESVASHYHVIAGSAPVTSRPVRTRAAAVTAPATEWR